MGIRSFLFGKDVTKGNFTSTLDISEGGSTSLAKMGKNQQVSMDVISRICHSLECNVGDIIDILPDDEIASLDKK